jgi:hypothetical protein
MARSQADDDTIVVAVAAGRNHRRLKIGIVTELTAV